MTQQQKKPKNKFTPGMGSGGSKKPSNFYWIYGVVIAESLKKW
jgi:hypothetical protein